MKTINQFKKDNHFVGNYQLSACYATELKPYDFLLIREKPESWAEGFNEVSALNKWAIEDKFEKDYVLDSEFYYAQIFSINYFGGYYTCKCQNGIEINIRRDIEVIKVDVNCMPSKTIVGIAKCLGEIKECFQPITLYPSKAI